MKNPRAARELSRLLAGLTSLRISCFLVSLEMSLRLIRFTIRSTISWTNQRRSFAEEFRLKNLFPVWRKFSR